MTKPPFTITKAGYFVKRHIFVQVLFLTFTPSIQYNRCYMKFRNWYILLILGFVGFNTFSQDIEHYTLSDGLTHQHVYKTFQDKDGYLWVGTWGGLSRFDGHSFTSFKHNPDNPLSIYGDVVHQIKEDQKGDLWVLSRDGLSKFNPQTENFTRLKPIHPYKEKTRRAIKQFFIDKNNLIWMLTKYDLYVYNQEKEIFFFVDIQEVYSEDGYMWEDTNGIWLISSKGMYFFDLNTLALKKKATKTEAIKAMDFTIDTEVKNISGVIKLSNGLFLARFNRNGIMQINTTTQSYEIISDTEKCNTQNWGWINFLFESEPGEIYIGTENSGILIFDPSTSTFLDNSLFNEELGSQTVYSIFRDNQKNLWVGTINGLYKFRLPALHFDYWFFDRGGSNSINPNKVSAINLDEPTNSLWVGTRSAGLKMVDLTNKTQKSIAQPQINGVLIGDNNVSSIFILNKEELLVGYDSMLWLYNPRSESFSEFKPVLKWARTIFRDKEDRLWITDVDSLTIAEYKSGEYCFRTMPHSDFGANESYMSSIIEDKNGQMWLGSTYGLVEFNETNPSASSIYIPPGSEPEPIVFSICEANDGIFWLGTIRNGIYAFNPKTKDFTRHYCDTSGLINNSVYAIMDDMKGNLWMSTQSGIARLNLQSHAITNISTSQGLPFHEFNSGAFYKAPNGKMYFGGEGGVIAFYPDSLIETVYETPLVIHSINSKRGKLPFQYPIVTGNEIVLKYDENSLEIYFGCLDYRSAKDRTYKYKLSGINNNWIVVTGNDRAAHFYNIDPGKYTFEIQSSYKNWSMQKEKFKLNIEVENKPLMQRGSFQISILAALLLSLVAALLLRLKNINMKKEMSIVRLEREANLSTLNFLKTQMNPHFIFNTLSAINSFVLTNNIRSANKYLTTFATLMREILESSKNEFVTIESEISTLRKYLLLQQLRFPDKFEFEFKVRPEVSIKKIPPMLIQPFLENSVEHAFKEMKVPGLLIVEFSIVDNSLICVVKDNGVGMSGSETKPGTEQRESTAIKNIQDRINILQKIYKTEISLDIKKASPENNDFPGTRIELILPDFGKTEKKTTEALRTQRTTKKTLMNFCSPTFGISG